MWQGSVRQGGVGQGGVGQGGVRQDEMKQDGVKQDGVKQEGVTQEEVTQEGVTQGGARWCDERDDIKDVMFQCLFYDIFLNSGIILNARWNEVMRLLALFPEAK